MLFSLCYIEMYYVFCMSQLMKTLSLIELYFKGANIEGFDKFYVQYVNVFFFTNILGFIIFFLCFNTSEIVLICGIIFYQNDRVYFLYVLR